AYAGGREPLAFSWRRKMEERREELPLRMRGTLAELVGLGEDSSSISAEVSIEVTQGAARQVKIALPAGVTVNQVPGANVTDWNARDSELLVTFLDPLEKSDSFVIQGEAHLPREGAIDIPILRLLEAEREGGGVAIETLGAGEIKEVKPQGFENADAAELGKMVAPRQSPSLAAFRLRTGAQARALRVEVARYAPQAMLTANVEEARYRVLLS